MGPSLSPSLLPFNSLQMYKRPPDSNGYPSTRHCHFIAMKLWHNLRQIVDGRSSRRVGFRQADGDLGRLLSEEENYGTTTAEDRTTNQTNSQPFESSPQRPRVFTKRLHTLIHLCISKWAYFKQFRILIPHIWPSKDWKTQVSILVMVLTFFKDRALRVFIPRQVGIIMGSIQSGCTDKVAIVANVFLWIFLETAFEFTIPEAAAMTHASYVATKNIARAFQAHILSLSMDFYRVERSAELRAALDDGDAISELIDEVILSLVPMLADLLIAMIYLYYTINGYVALAVLLLTATYFSVAYYGISWISGTNRAYVEKHRQIGHELQDSIQNWPAIFCYRRHDYESRRFSKILDELLRARTVYHMRHYLVANAQKLLLRFALLGAASATILDITRGASSPSNFAVLLAYWSAISNNLTGLTKTLRKFGAMLVSAEKLVKIFQAKPTIVGGSKQLQMQAGYISFEDVSFTYKGQVTGVQNIDFRVTGGSTVALVGESGGGKSTLANLLLRLDDVNSGAIKVDDQDIRDVTLSSLGDAIGVVPQNPFIFDRSIMDNVRFGRLDATDDEVMEVCKAVGLHDSIMKFEERYETKVGERAKRISGGQGQRIGIARVLLRRPKVIIFDEPTSAVDLGTEAKIKAAFDNLGYPHTSVIIAHRLSTIKDADLILVLHESRIKEMGSHSELMTQHGAYHELWSSQSK